MPDVMEFDLQGMDPATVTPEDEKAMERALAEFLRGLLDPGTRLPVDEWAEKYLDLSPRVTRYSGRVRIDRTPYMRGPLRAYTQGKLRRHVFIWAPQVGKTLMLQIIMGYDVDNNPGPMMIVYPDRNTAKRRSRKHLLPLIRDSAVLNRHTTGRPDDLQLFEYALDRMTINVAWAGSPSMMAGESIRHLRRDEFAKYKHNDKDEAHPMELSKRRVAAYSPGETIVDATTPGLVGKYGDKDLKEGTWHEYWVPCPHCGKPDQVQHIQDPVLDVAEAELVGIRDQLTAAGFQVLEWDNITWDKKQKSTEAMAATAHYVCPQCQGRVEHHQVHAMTLLGKWVPRYADRAHYSWHLPSWYRDMAESTFSAVVERWLKALGDPTKIQDCLNGDRAIGYEEQGVQKTESEIRKNCCRGYALRTVPFTPVFLFMTADLRAPEIHFVVRAWTYDETSGQVIYGVLPRLKAWREGDIPTGESLAVLDKLLERTYKAVDGHEYPITLTGIDSGFNTDEVYAYCRTRGNCVAMKSEEGMTQILKFSKPEIEPISKAPRPDSCNLVSWNHTYFADVLDGRMGVGEGLPGEWMLPNDIGDDLLVHLIAEKKKQITSRWGRGRTAWVTVNKRNHWLDCERQQFVLARLLDLAGMKPTQPEVPAPRETTTNFMGRDVSGFTDRFGR